MGALSKLWCLGPRRCQDRVRLLTIYKFRDLELATGNFAEENLLGRGSYGSVYKAVLKNGQLAAVKRATCTTANPSTSKERFILSQIECPHVVNLLGFCERNDEVLLVVEFMANGSLHDVLHSKLSSSSLSWSRRVRIAVQTARALHALHSSTPQIIHRDVKSSNVLIDANWNARLGDFGLALRGDTKDIMCTPAGTLGYVDPRYDKPEKVGPKIDVFSFGVLLLELISGRQVIDDRMSPVRMVDWALPLIKQGRALAICDPRVRIPEGEAAGIKRMAVLAARCVRRESKRPCMGDIVLTLCQIQRDRFHTSRSSRKMVIKRAILSCPKDTGVISFDERFSSSSKSKSKWSLQQGGDQQKVIKVDVPYRKLEFPPPINQPVTLRSSHI
ncbi:serine/threonine-protein kinase-like protein At3g51990 [Selaginella moellendorffii]|nr:serine/threonine-protein kinase-like protein At3g51990 [Selaginella moellendorffii]|eukprot:XP_002985186.2 serine/threonine-protein kinase-like protein At3g51990 [Selaginella moellendorffii]